MGGAVAPASDRVFVTGGSGFIGGALVKRLVDEGRHVLALARSADAVGTLGAAGAEPVRGGLESSSTLLAAMRGCGTVFHVAGVNATCLRDPSEMLHANIDGVAAVIRAAASAGVGRVVHTSSAATIGEPEGVVAREDTAHRGWFLSDYERSKFLGERRALDLGTTLGIDVVSVNPSSVQGPGRIEGSARLLIDLVNGKLPVLVDTHLSIVDIDDCTEAHLLAETHGVAGRRYLVSGASLTTPEAVQLLRDACGHPKRARYAPRSVITFAGAFGGVLTWLTHRDLPLCSESTRVLLHGHRYDGSLAERELGLAYTPVEETVRRTLAWYAQQGLAPALLESAGEAKAADGGPDGEGTSVPASEERSRRRMWRRRGGAARPRRPGRHPR
ncbi:MAG: NAD-dependent epimerase/dehydratase family protein [Actinomycetota bacterium]